MKIQVLFSLLSLLLVAVASAETPIPDDIILVNGKVTDIAKLQWSDTQSQIPGGPKGTQFAKVKLKVKCKAPKGYKITGYVWNCQWAKVTRYPDIPYAFVDDPRSIMETPEARELWVANRDE